VLVAPPHLAMPDSKVTVIGSFAVGLTLRADRFPTKGETLIGVISIRAPVARAVIRLCRPPA